MPLGGVHTKSPQLDDLAVRERHRLGEQPALNYLSIDEAVLHCTRGLGTRGRDWVWPG